MKHHVMSEHHGLTLEEAKENKQTNKQTWNVTESIKLPIQ